MRPHWRGRWRRVDEAHFLRSPPSPIMRETSKLSQSLAKLECECILSGYHLRSMSLCGQTFIEENQERRMMRSRAVV